jgi:hypothetical protein
MAVELNDNDINLLMSEPKVLPADYQKHLGKMKNKQGHSESELVIDRKDGSLFKIIKRHNRINQLDFSLILVYIPEKSNSEFRLLRCNGKSHEHSNKLEKNKFYDFHIHRATERYQEFGYDEDSFAEITHEYADINGAWDYFLKTGNIKTPAGDQAHLF